MRRQVEIYDPRANAWRKARAMAAPRAYGAAAAVDGRVYALGGMRSHVRARPCLFIACPLTAALSLTCLRRQWYIRHMHMAAEHLESHLVNCKLAN